MAPKYSHQAGYAIECTENHELFGVRIVEGNRIICDSGYTEAPDRRCDTFVLQIHNGGSGVDRSFLLFHFVRMHDTCAAKVNRLSRCNSRCQCYRYKKAHDCSHSMNPLISNGHTALILACETMPAARFLSLHRFNGSDLKKTRTSSTFFLACLAAMQLEGVMLGEF
jgi:hypothetical protein